MTVVISFVIDDAPKFLMQGWNLFLSMIESKNVPREDTTVVVNYVEGVDPARLDMSVSAGARLAPVKALGKSRAVQPIGDCWLPARA